MEAEKGAYELRVGEEFVTAYDSREEAEAAAAWYLQTYGRELSVERHTITLPSPAGHGSRTPSERVCQLDSDRAGAILERSAAVIAAATTLVENEDGPTLDDMVALQDALADLRSVE